MENTSDISARRMHLLLDTFKVRDRFKSAKIALDEAEAYNAKVTDIYRDYTTLFEIGSHAYLNAQIEIEEAQVAYHDENTAYTEAMDALQTIALQTALNDIDAEIAAGIVADEEIDKDDNSYEPYTAYERYAGIPVSELTPAYAKELDMSSMYSHI